MTDRAGIEQATLLQIRRCTTQLRHQSAFMVSRCRLVTLRYFLEVIVIHFTVVLVYCMDGCVVGMYGACVCGRGGCVRERGVCVIGRMRKTWSGGGAVRRVASESASDAGAEVNGAAAEDCAGGTCALQHVYYNQR